MARRILADRHRDVSALGTLVPAGAAPVAAGLVASGAGAYAFLVLASHHLTPHRYGELAAFWSLTFLVGPGCFTGLEKELGLRLADAGARGDASAPLTRRVGWLGLGLVVLLSGATLALEPTIRVHAFDGDRLLYGALILSFFTMWAQNMAWGVLAGSGEFRSYARITAGEGGLRLVGGGLAVLSGIATPGVFGLVIALAPLLAAALSLRTVARCGRRGADIAVASVARSLTYLLAAAVMSSVLINAGPLVLKLLAGRGHAAQAGALLSALVLVRIPLFLYTAASATLLPALSTHLATGSIRLFRAALGRLCLVATAAGVVAVAGAASGGPWALRLLFGRAYVLGRLDLALLACSAAALLLAVTVSVALTALGALRGVVAAWGAGVAAMVVATLSISPLLARVEIGMLAGAVVAAGAMLGCLVHRAPRVAASP